MNKEKLKKFKVGELDLRPLEDDDLTAAGAQVTENINCGCGDDDGGGGSGCTQWWCLWYPGAA